ncbi:MAG: phosphatidate cytidylyltransferase [Ruminococcus sp.]|nr:phosphatidate cytidylyltransferase [Ruminococcus sp.]
MVTRLISSAVGIVLCIGLMIIGERNPIVITVAISLVTGLMCGELLTAKKLHKNLKIAIPSIIFGIAMPILSSTGFAFVALYLFAIIIFITSVICHDYISSEDTLFTFGGCSLITLSMTSFAYTACGKCGLSPLFVSSCNDKAYTAFFIVITLAIPWLADSGAYFTGMLLGKHKLCPNISPKKTVEGAVGGLVCGFLAVFLVRFVFTFIYPDATINYIPLIIIGLINPIVSIFGDLTFSIIKRSCGIKDFGSIMPGHGGMLDRFDSIILCAPLVYIVSQYFTVIC